MESAESGNGQLQRVNAWVGEVREGGMRCIDLSRNDVYGDGDTFWELAMIKDRFRR